MGAIVVIAVDNMVVVMALDMILVHVIVIAMVVLDAGIDIIVRANSVQVIGIAGRETDAAVMLSIGTLIIM
jgi:hypothetical protein